MDFLPSLPWDTMIYLALAGALAWAINDWISRRRESRDRPDWRELVLRVGLGSTPPVCRIRYDPTLEEGWCREHAATLSWILGELRPILLRIYSVPEPAPIFISEVTVTTEVLRVDGRLVSGLVTFSPDYGARIWINPGRSMDPLNGGAFSWELRNVVRDLNAGIPSGGPFEFESPAGGEAADDAAAAAAAEYVSRR